jgi:hypothetical protein
MNPTKLASHFSDFSVIFYAIYKKQPNGFTIGVNLLQGGPRKDLGFCNVAPKRPGSGGPAKFRRAAAGLGQGRAWEGPRGHWGAIWGLGRGRERAGEGRRRRPGLVAAAACRASEVGVSEGVDTPASLVRCKGRWQKRLIGLPAGRPWRSPRLPSMAPAAAWPWARRGGGGGAPFMGGQGACK